MEKFSKDRIDPDKLLSEFVSSEFSEEAFANLVKHLGGVVYGCAFRKLQNKSLAEEVTQDVFAILARKAVSLQKHPSLSAWLFKTAEYQSLKALRFHTRHQKRIESYTSYLMNDKCGDEVIQKESLRLLDESISALSEQEQILVLGRFFEGKSFRELAHKEGKTEAACKMQLKRILDKMSEWLGARGCSVGGAGLAALLTSEFSKAAPASIVSLASAALESSKNISLPTLLLQMMKVSSFLSRAAPLLLGLSAVAATVWLANNQTEEKEVKHQPANTYSLSEISKSTERAKSDRSKEGVMLYFLSSYPYAQERLEEIYLQYPNLIRSWPFSEKEIHPLVSFAKDLPYLGMDLNDDLKTMLRGTGEWDEKQVQAFLNQFKDLFEKAEYYALGDYHVYKKHWRYTDSSEHIMKLIKFRDVLRLKMRSALGGGREKEALHTFTLGVRLGELSRKQAIYNVIAGESLGSVLKSDLRNYYEQGMNLIPFKGEISGGMRTSDYADALRTEFSGLISFFEGLSSDEELREQLAPNIIDASIIDTSLLEGNRERFEEAFVNSDMKQFQDGLAELTSIMIYKLYDYENGLVFLNPQVVEESIKEQVSKYHPDTAILLEGIVGPLFQLAVKRLVQSDQWRVDLSVLVAIQEAAQKGVEVETLNDLVPEYLPDLPVDPASGEALIYDQNTGLVSFPNDLRRLKK